LNNNIFEGIDDGQNQNIQRFGSVAGSIESDGDDLSTNENFSEEETYGLSSQMQRAAVSIPSNIAEGHSRTHTKEYLYHLSVAKAH